MQAVKNAYRMTDKAMLAALNAICWEEFVFSPTLTLKSMYNQAFMFDYLLRLFGNMCCLCFPRGHWSFALDCQVECFPLLNRYFMVKWVLKCELCKKVFSFTGINGIGFLKTFKNILKTVETSSLSLSLSVSLSPSLSPSPPLPPSLCDEWSQSMIGVGCKGDLTRGAYCTCVYVYR